MSDRKEHIEKILEDMGLDWAEVKQEDDFTDPDVDGKDQCEITFRCGGRVNIRKDESDADIKAGIVTILNKLKEGLEQTIKNVIQKLIR